MVDVLDTRALNRATLARQLLLERVEADPVDVVERLVGLQAQTVQSWYVGLWSRLAGFDPVTAGAALEARRLVRIAAMRSTIHLLTADDAGPLRAFSQPALDAQLRTAFGADGLARFDRDTAAELIRDALADGPRTAGDLAAVLAERFPGQPELALTLAARGLVPLVQVPPRGVWKRSGPPLLMDLERWTGRPAAPPEPEAIVLRYLGAFGPASVKDVQRWAGVTRLGPVLERLRPQLVTFRSVDGRELFDLPDAPRPAPDTPAPPRLLYDFDNVLLSHDDRSRVVTERWTAAFRGRGQPHPVLIDGLAQGRWDLRDGVVELELWTRPSRADRAALDAEVAALTRLLTG